MSTVMNQRVKVEKTLTEWHEEKPKHLWFKQFAIALKFVPGFGH